MAAIGFGLSKDAFTSLMKEVIFSLSELLIQKRNFFALFCCNQFVFFFKSYSSPFLCQKPSLGYLVGSKVWHELFDLIMYFCRDALRDQQSLYSIHIQFL